MEECVHIFNSGYLLIDDMVHAYILAYYHYVM